MTISAVAKSCWEADVVDTNDIQHASHKVGRAPWRARGPNDPWRTVLVPGPKKLNRSAPLSANGDCEV